MRSDFYFIKKETDGGGYTLLKELFDEIIKKKKICSLYYGLKITIISKNTFK